MLVGNKCDQTDRKEVNYTTGKQLVDDLGISFTESAKSGTNTSPILLSNYSIIKQRIQSMTECTRKAERRSVKVSPKRYYNHMTNDMITREWNM